MSAAIVLAVAAVVTVCVSLALSRLHRLAGFFSDPGSGIQLFWISGFI